MCCSLRVAIMKNLRTVIIIFLLLECVSCRPKYHLEPCEDPRLVVAFRDFDSLELYTIIARKYEKASGFTEELDSVLLDSNYYKRNGNINYPVSIGYNWVFELPSVQKIYYLEDIRFVEEPGENRLIYSGEVHGCTNTVTYNLDDAEYTINGRRDASYPDGYYSTITISK